METSATHVPASSWRAGTGASETDLGSVYLQPSRLDVLVHLLAYEQLAGVEPVTASHDWVAASDEFAARDNEPTVATLAAELMSGSSIELPVTFTSGGQLVRGASAAAVALATGRKATRVDGADKVIDRSVTGLAAAGWQNNKLQALLTEWARRDAAAVVVFVDLDAEGADDALHELTCRYAVVHSELDYLSVDDAKRLDASGHGSTQILCLRSGDTLDAVLERHAHALHGHIAGSAGAIALATLWRSERSTNVSPAHTQRLRRNKRRQVKDQLLERALGR